MTSGASPLCQRWRDRRHSWRPASEGGFDARRYDVAAVAEPLARAYVEANHYSASYPAARLRYGLHARGGHLVGVAVLSVPVRAAVLTAVFPDLAPYRESLELGRFVLDDDVPANGETWFLARCFALASAAGLRGVVSFSDPVARRRADGTLVFPGHVGTIYQAANARYLGRGTPRSLVLLPDGAVLNDRSLQKVRGQEQGHEGVERLLRGWGAPARGSEEPRAWLGRALATVGARRVRHGGCHKYGFALGDRRRRRLFAAAAPVLPYPKREAA